MSQYLREHLEDIDLHPGAGRISGSIGLFLGLLCVLGSLCFAFPEQLTTPDFRPLYDTAVLQHILNISILGSFGFGLFSAMRSRRRYLGLGAMLTAASAAWVAAGKLTIHTPTDTSFYAGIDYFVITLLVLAMVFIPMERLFAKNRLQKVLRKGWVTDLKYFLFSHVGLQLIGFLTIVPVQMFFNWAIDSDFQKAVASQPYWLQFIQILLAVDLLTYWIHRAMHEVPWLWKIHAVHHSSEHMDWLASSRLHIIELVANRFIGYIPLFVMGFAVVPTYAYLVFISFHAIFIHANVRFKIPVLRHILTTPEYHHWHHSSEDAAVDKNYASFLPIYDRLFGTHYLPGHFSEKYGVRSNPPGEGMWKQFLHPFKKQHQE